MPDSAAQLEPRTIAIDSNNRKACFTVAQLLGVSGTVVLILSLHSLTDVTFHPCSPCSIAGSVIILPRMLPMLHNKGHANVTSAFPPPAVWDVPIVLGMLEKYIAVAGVATVPSLQEYAVLPDKVALHGMYAAHQAQVQRLAS